MHVSRKVVMINNTTAYNAPSPGSSTPGSGGGVPGWIGRDSERYAGFNIESPTLELQFSY